MAGSDDWLGGYTLEELLGAAPVSKTKKQMKKEKKAANKAAGKRGIVSKTLGAPFRLVAGLIKLPVSLISNIIKTPFRLIGFILKPVRRKRR